jgi:CRISPR-associated protein Cmr1
MKKMNTMKATFVINTPMFLGDYQSDKTAEIIRPPSVKGALRFWWRALMWSSFRKQAATETEALQHLHRKEAELFGIAAETYKDLAQASVLLTVLSDTKPATKTLGALDFWHGYLLGQGLSHFKDGLLRNAIPSPGSFQVILYFKKSVSKEDQQSVLQALQVFGLLGGLGSRMRRGWGSVSLIELDFAGEKQPIAGDKNQYIAMLKHLLTDLVKEEPPFSAFSQKTQILLEKSYRNPLDALKKAGEEMAMYRSWGRNSMVNGQRAEKNFKGDHDMVLAIGNNIRAARPTGVPKRTVFGLPHNYFYSSQQPVIKVDVNAAGAKRTRRGSPLFIHIQKIGNQYFLLQTVLQAKFLPTGDPVEFKVRRDGAKTTNTAVDWEVLNTYLARFPTTRILP